MVEDLIKIGISILCSILLGFERESQDKLAGVRTIILISLGATLTTIFTLKFIKIGSSFDAIRAIAYYLVGIGFIGGGIINKSRKTDGITTASLILPVSLIGALCGIGEFYLAITSTLIIFLVLMSKYIHTKFKDNFIKIWFGGKHGQINKKIKRLNRRIRKRTKGSCQSLYL